EHLGRTPLRTDVLPPGEYVLRLQHRGYHDHEVTVDVEPGTVAEVNTTLARVTGVLQVESNLPAIKFVARSVNADVPPREGVTPTELTLPTGRYVIVFQHTEAAPRHFVADVT